MAKHSNTAVATVEASGVATTMEVPSYLAAYGAIGSENVRTEDKVLARLTLLQGLSPEVTKGDAKFVESARAGDIFHTVLGTTHETILFVDAFFRVEYGVFRKRIKGGGFRGIEMTEAKATALLDAQKDKDDCEIVAQSVHYGIALDPVTKESLGEVALVMVSTKLKVSRKMNSLIDSYLIEKGYPRFGGVWKLSVVAEKNEKGPYFNFAISPAGFTPEKVAKAAFKLYQDTLAGIAKAGFEETDATASAPERANQNLEAEI
jgi:hypothetical protein